MAQYLENHLRHAIFIENSASLYTAKLIKQFYNLNSIDKIY